MSLSYSPSAPSSALTRADPPLVDPPSQTSSAFAALSSDGTSILRSSRSTVEPGGGFPRSARRTSIAIATLSVEAAGNSARAFHMARLPVRTSPTKIPQSPEKPRARPRTVRPSRASPCPRGGARGLAESGRPKTRATVVAERRPDAVTAMTVTRTSRGGSATWKSNVLRPPRRSRFAATRRSMLTTTTDVPRATRPAIRPNDTSLALGATSTGGGSATGTRL
jgi:hypothetical protein